MKIASSILAMSLLMSNVGFANEQSADDEVFTTDGDVEIFTADDGSDFVVFEEEERAVPIVAIISLAVTAVKLGCDRAKDEGKALRKRDPSAKKTYVNNRWKVRAAVAPLGLGALTVLRCFEHGLYGN